MTNFLLIKYPQQPDFGAGTPSMAKIKNQSNFSVYYEGYRPRDSVELRD
jgi:hypothetical protein